MKQHTQIEQLYDRDRTNNIRLNNYITVIYTLTQLEGRLFSWFV